MGETYHRQIFIAEDKGVVAKSYARYKFWSVAEGRREDTGDDLLSRGKIG